VNVMVVLDTSPGMSQTNAQGLSRMEQARLALQDLLPRLHGERLGLALYGQGAGVLLPCTDDLAIFGHALQQASPELLQAQRSAGLPGALELARRELLATPGASRAILLVAGADPARPVSEALQRQLEQQAASLRAAGIPVFVLMLEKTAWFGTSTSALDSRILAEFAHATGGASSQLGDDPWAALYTRGLARLPSNPMPAGEVVAWRELYAAPLLGAFLLMLLLSLPWAQPAMRDSQTDMQGEWWSRRTTVARPEHTVARPGKAAHRACPGIGAGPVHAVHGAATGSGANQGARGTASLGCLEGLACRPFCASVATLCRAAWVRCPHG
jgi:hypothetical protein